ncbi:unnamed protein product [Caenorhabditis bovis]|uniref:Uncharacterized protein n=1 Tax=Caenorhabditis bovis TaxID=2654633 RepID=A0A8S1F5P6_9PELO|nr:unnamed protein product [Caenorhabditis bovis]
MIFLLLFILPSFRVFAQVTTPQLFSKCSISDIDRVLSEHENYCMTDDEVDKLCELQMSTEKANDGNADSSTRTIIPSSIIYSTQSDSTDYTETITTKPVSPDYKDDYLKYVPVSKPEETSSTIAIETTRIHATATTKQVEIETNDYRTTLAQSHIIPETTTIRGKTSRISVTAPSQSSMTTETSTIDVIAPTRSRIFNDANVNANGYANGFAKGYANVYAKGYANVNAKGCANVNANDYANGYANVKQLVDN